MLLAWYVCPMQVATVRLCGGFSWVHGDLADLWNVQSLPELINAWVVGAVRFWIIHPEPARADQLFMGWIALWEI